MENKEIMAAPIKNRFIAFIIDIFFVYLLRVFFINFSLYFWLKQPILNFITKYRLLYGEIDFNKITSIEIAYFINSDLFKYFIIFIAGIFLVSIIYNFCFFCSKWSATLGQKLMGIYVISKNGTKINILHSMIRSLMITLPWVFIFILLFYSFLSNYKLVEPLSKSLSVISLLIILSWYDMIFLTKDKLLFHDYFTSTRVIVKNPQKYLSSNQMSLWNFLFPDFKSMYSNLKQNFKNQVGKVKEIKTEYKKTKKNKKKN